jgi:formate dehydrogenase subunit delta
MDAKRLTAMANEIGAFFRLQGESAAVAGIEDHMRKYWDPRMRRQIIDHLASGGDGLELVVRAAVARLDGSAEAKPV